MRFPMMAWIAGLCLVIGLYTLGPVMFNRALPLILFLPPLLFWFVLIPLATPLIMGVVYLIDQRDSVIEDEGRS
jgi:hypothetical protein